MVQEYRLTPNGEVEVMLEFEDYRPIRGPGVTATGAASDAFTPVLRPFKVTIKDGHGQGTLLLTFKEIVPNPSLRPEDLGVAGPKGGGAPMGLSRAASWSP